MDCHVATFLAMTDQLIKKLPVVLPAIFYKRTSFFYSYLCINSHLYSFSNFCKVTCADAAVKEFL